jgi:hypothetical protein
MTKVNHALTNKHYILFLKIPISTEVRVQKFVRKIRQFLLDKEQEQRLFF